MPQDPASNGEPTPANVPEIEACADRLMDALKAYTEAAKSIPTRKDSVALAEQLIREIAKQAFLDTY